MQQSIRVVRFPLKLKFTLTLGLLLTGTLITFLWLATSLIRQDKAAYVFDAILMRTEQQASSLQVRLSGWRSVLQKTPNLSRLALESPEITFLSQGEDVLYKSETDSGSWSGFPVKSWQVVNQNDQRYLILDGNSRRLVVNLNKISNANDSGPFQMELYSNDGSILISQKLKSALVGKDHWLWSFLENKNSQGVQEVGSDLIVAYAKIPSLGWILTSSISRQKAFAVAGYLIDKSLFFGLLILGVAILFGILAVKPLTKQLEELGLLTQAVGSGDFSQRIKPRTHDEAGALADSFNMMAEKITIYMGEMKEKARIENELKVAQIVQKAFFPPASVKLPGLELKAFNAPASECGGDWWGHVQLKDTTLIMIADATGHGVSAALLTATANACKEGLKSLFELDPSIAQSPARVMQYLNKTVCSSGDQIQMTCFVASWHSPSRSLQYCNASHQPALIYVAPQDREATKDDLRPLLEANGARLGQDYSSVYSENYVELPANARMVLYTDGLTEAANPEGQAWGQRRFLKSLIESLSMDGNPETVVAAMNVHHQSSDYEDDVTLVYARFE
ncbi:MAG: SpoIIE family protein phosphatase [Bacteriovoracaceae bacterium]|nr:SpoIIE family protein phosphatase [Bacteriovoracaceae bacterium]